LWGFCGDSRPGPLHRSLDYGLRRSQRPYATSDAHPYDCGDCPPLRFSVMLSLSLCSEQIKQMNKLTSVKTPAIKPSNLNR
jgi:hypothetical protein